MESTFEERRLLADSARSWVRQRASTKAVREVNEHHSDRGYDPALFAEMVEMGWTGMIVPGEYGGHDFGFESMGVLVEELGRTLVPSPLIPSAVGAASALILGGDDEQKRRWLEPLAAGRSIGTLAIEEGRRFDLDKLDVQARRHADGWLLNGRKQPVEAGMAADLIIVVARIEDGCGGNGVSLFLCRSDMPGIERRPLEEVDVRGRASIEFRDTVVGAGDMLRRPDQGVALVERVLERTAAVAAAEMLGGAKQAFDTTMDYLKTRTQFGQLIGSFQALQHRAADMAAEIGLTRAAVHEALRALDREDERASLLISVAKIVAGKTFHKVAREMIQMHGGIGMTSEHDAGLYFKRAQAADMFCGNVAYHRERAARLIGL